MEARGVPNYFLASMEERGVPNYPLASMEERGLPTDLCFYEVYIILVNFIFIMFFW